MRFETETDTEVVAQLVTREMRQGTSAVEAVAATLPRLRGAFALAFLFAGEDDLLIGARQARRWRSATARARCISAPTPLALAPFTDAITYLEDGDWAVADAATGAEIRDRRRPRRSSGRASAFRPATFMVDKGNHRHFMAKEIHEQPEVVGRTLAHYVDFAAGKVVLPIALPFDFKALKRHVDLGLRHRLSTPGWSPSTGSSASPACRSRSTSPRSSATASRRWSDGQLALFISQSGETADTLASLRYAKAQGQHVVAVVNVPTSTIARESAVVAPTLAGPEIGVASTKAFTCQLTVLLCLAIAAGRARGTLCRDGGGRARRRAHRGAGPDGRGAEARARRSRCSPASSPRRATCSISAAAPPIRWRSKAR